MAAVYLALPNGIGCASLGSSSGVFGWPPFFLGSESLTPGPLGGGANLKFPTRGNLELPKGTAVVLHRCPVREVENVVYSYTMEEKTCLL